MAEKLNTRCQICGKMYNHCLKCKQMEGWKAIADTHEHYQMAMILMEYREGVISAIEATGQFKNIGITLNSDYSGILPEVATLIKTIIKNGTVSTTETKSDHKKKYTK